MGPDGQNPPQSPHTHSSVCEWTGPRETLRPCNCSAALERTETGLYRFSSNPIFLDDVAILLARGHLAGLVYALLVFFGLHVWVVLHEEPVVHARLGEDWKRYVARIPRWIG